MIASKCDGNRNIIQLCVTMCQPDNKKREDSGKDSLHTSTGHFIVFM
jgi:hypothetical protein